MLRNLDLRRNNWNKDKLDHEYYEKLTEISKEVFGKIEIKRDPDEKEAVEVFVRNESGKDQKRDSEHQVTVEVSGVEINLVSINREILNKSALSLAQLFEYHVPQGAQSRE